MIPFDHDFDQNDLIAYHLQELSPRRQRALRRALQQDAALAAESEAIVATLRAFPKDEPSPPVDAGMLERSWLALLPSLVVHFPQTRTPRSLFRRRHLLAYAGTALAAAALVISLNHYRRAQPSAVATIATPSETVPPLSPSTGSNSVLSSGLQPNASIPRPWIVNHLWPSPSAPTQSDGSGTSDNPQTSLTAPPPQPFTPQMPVQPSPVEPSPANTIVAPTEGAASLSSNTPPMPSSTQFNTVRHSSKVHRPYPADITLAIFGDLIPSRTSTYNSGTGAPLVITSRSPTTESAVGALASFHQQFNPWLGYRITTTYSHPTFQYSYNSSSTSTDGIEGSTTATDSIYELSGTYVVRGPHHSRLTTSAEAGAGLLAFLPDNESRTGAATTKAFRPAASVGVSADIALTRHWVLHTGYRALLYNSPGFYSPNAATSSAFTFNSNPIVGVTYNFGVRGND